MNNTRLIKFILPLHKSWFWLSIWMFYYLSITNYAGVGIIETVVFGMSFLLEVPTGIITDRIGRKKSAVLGLILGIAGTTIMGLAASFLILLLSGVILSIGMPLLSGTLEALLFDSLKAEGKEDEYEKHWSEASKYSFIAMALAALVGGYLYTKHPSLPFYLTAAAEFIGLLLMLKVVEPPIYNKDSGEESKPKQTIISNVAHLFKQLPTKTLLVLIPISAVLAAFINYLLDALLIAKSLTPVEITWFYFVVTIIGAGCVHWYENKKVVSTLTTVIPLMVLMIVATIGGTLLIDTKYVFLFLMGVFVITEPLYNIFVSNTINHQVESHSRATALSTFTMIKNLPYVLMAIILGLSIDSTAVEPVVRSVLIIFMTIIVLPLGYLLFNKKG